MTIRGAEGLNDGDLRQLIDQGARVLKIVLGGRDGRSGRIP